ncbi:MAG: hydrogen gas-evolving membrane-bound hydrogenase subunit E, partial [Gemmatimonas sp.]
ALYGGPGTALPAYKLSLWHGFNLPLLMSVIAVVGGIALYFGLQKFVNLHRLDRLPLWLRSGGREAFAVLLDAGVALASAATSRLQNGRLQHYLLALVGMALVAGVWPFLQGLPAVNDAPLHFDGLSPGVAAVGIIGIAMTLATTWFYRQRLVALLLMGAVGLVVCLAFAWFSAPDLALTQLLVEVVTIVLMMLALHWLPAESPPLRRRGLAMLHGGVAIACGVGAAVLTWLVIAAPFDSISPFFLERTIVEGGGANSVNVILVDFRGFDTMGEITVLGIAAITIHALLSRFTPPPGSALSAPVASVAPGTMLQLVSRLVMPFAVLITIYLYLCGHNMP